MSGYVSVVYPLIVFSVNRFVIEMNKLPDTRKSEDVSLRFFLCEPKAGLEPATYALRMRCSTN